MVEDLVTDPEPDLTDELFEDEHEEIVRATRLSLGAGAVINLLCTHTYAPIEQGQELLQEVINILDHYIYYVPESEIAHIIAAVGGEEIVSGNA